MANITEHIESAPATPTPAGAAKSPTSPPSRTPAGLITAPSPPPIATLMEVEAEMPVMRDDDDVLRGQMQALKERYEAVYRTFKDFPGFVRRPLVEADREQGETRLAFKNRQLLAAEERRLHILRQEVWLKANPDFGEAVAEMAAEDRQKGKGRPRPKQATRQQRSEEIPDIEEIPPPTPSVPSTVSKRGRSPSEEEPHPKKQRKSSVKANLSREMQRARKKAEDDRARAAEEKKRLTEIEKASKVGKKQEIPCERCGDAGIDCYRKGQNACSRCNITHNPCVFPSVFSKVDQLNENIITLNETLRFGFYMLGTEFRVFDRNDMFNSWAKDFLKPYERWTAEGDKGYQREKQREAEEQAGMHAGPSGTSHEDIEVVISDSEKGANDEHDEMQVDEDDAQEQVEDDEEEQEEHEQDQDEDEQEED